MIAMLDNGQVSAYPDYQYIKDKFIFFGNGWDIKEVSLISSTCIPYQL